MGGTPALSLQQLQEIYADPRDAVSVVSRCSRALLLAHFDTAIEQRPRDFEGATEKSVSDRLSASDVSPSAWESYTRLWHAYTENWESKVRQRKRGKQSGTRTKHEADVSAPRLRCENGVYNILGRRVRGGKYAVTRPAVWTIVRRLLEDTLPPLLLSDLHRIERLRYYGIKDTPEFGLYAQDFFSAFNAIPGDIVSRADLLVLVDPAPYGQTGRAAEALVETLDGLAILNFTYRNLEGHQIRFKADPQFVLTNLFGRSTGVEGLDYLFFGGVWSPGGTSGTENMSVVVSGSAGTGKSTLALGLGVQAAARGGLCLFFRLEPDEPSVVRQVAQHHRHLVPFFDIESHTGARLQLQGDTMSPPATQRGKLVISDLATSPMEDIRGALLNLANASRFHDYEERLAIVDSISSAYGYGDNQHEWRQFLFETARVLRSLGYVIIYLVETDRESGKNSFEDYVADLDIRLYRKETPHGPYPFRVLEIGKSRWQATHRGSHVFTIQSGGPIRLFPSSAAVQSARSVRELRMYHKRPPIAPGIDGFSKAFGRHPGQDSVTRWWLQGSVTALTGARGTLKSSFAKHFAEGLNREETKSDLAASALSLHFADELESAFSKFQRQMRRPAEVGVRYDIPLRGWRAGDDGLSSEICYILFRSGYLAPGHILNAVRKILAEKRRQQTPIRRAVISDAGNLTANFPALRDDPVFLPTLCTLLSSEGITTVIVYSEPARPAEDDPVLDQIRTTAENIIKFDASVFEGRERTTLRVERSTDFSHDREAHEIEEIGGKLRVTRKSDLILDVRQGAPQLAKVHIILDAGTELQKEYHTELQRFHRALGSYSIALLDNTTTTYRRSIPLSYMGAQSALWIVQFDAFQLPAIMGSPNAKPHNPLCELPIEESRHLDELIYLPGTARQKKLSIPYFLNPSFLVACREFLEFSAKSGLGRIAAGQGEYSWAELIDAAEAFRATNPGYSLFGYAEETLETLNCLFMEILGSIMMLSRQSTGRFDGVFSPQWDEASVLEACKIVCRLLRGGSAEPLRTKGHPTDNNRAVFWRHWYTTYRQMTHSIHESDVEPIRLPGNIWMCGDWHFAILGGSTGIRRGVEIIFEQFVNKPNSLNLLARGLGLPPYQAFYDDQNHEVPTPELEWFTSYVRGEGVLYRSQVPQYSTRAPFMSSALAALLTSKNPAVDTAAHSICTLMSQAIHWDR